MNVPEKHEDVAKNLGAKWDAKVVKWYAPPEVDHKLIQMVVNQAIENDFQGLQKEDNPISDDKSGCNIEGSGDNDESEPYEKLCPKCAKPMIIKSGRNGEFLGCTAYPKCKYSENI